MKTPLRIVIAGAPVGKGRPRATKGGRMYTPAKTANTEAFVKSEAIRQVGQPVLEGPLLVEITATVPIPGSWSKKKQIDAAVGNIQPTGKPDLDNIAKLYSDALNGIVWKDDSQIVALRMAKQYGATPNVTLTVSKVLNAA